LYDKYSSQMYSVCLRYCRSKEDANDVFQDAFFLVYKNIKQVKNPNALSGWIKTIFINTSLAALKAKAKYSTHKSIEESEVYLRSWNQVIQDISATEIRSLISKLPTGCRMVFNLYAVEGYTHKEIAEKLDISVGTSKSQLFDARKALKAALNNLGLINTVITDVA
jgi:RNA polymerase sigma factor (sigma-70 family)